MGFRDTLNKNPMLSYGIAGGFVVVALGLLAFHFWPDKAVNMDKSYYTTDDGQTTFVDDSNKYPPFDHDGKQAVKVLMFSYDNGSKTFVGMLVRYTPDQAAKFNAEAANGQTPSMFDLKATQEVKAPYNNPLNSQGWVPSDSVVGHKIGAVVSPDGSALDSAVPGYNAPGS